MRQEETTLDSVTYILLVNRVLMTVYNVSVLT